MFYYSEMSTQGKEQRMTSFINRIEGEIILLFKNEIHEVVGGVEPNLLHKEIKRMSTTTPTSVS